MTKHALRPRKIAAARANPSVVATAGRRHSGQASAESFDSSLQDGLAVAPGCGPDGDDTGFPVEGRATPTFSRCYTRASLVDKLGNPVSIDFTCSISVGFFKVKQDWICYRRNYISVAAQLVHPTFEAAFVHGPELQRVNGFAFCISAVTAADPPCPIELVQHTPKRDKGPQQSPQFIPLSAPSYHAHWDRIQYKTATGNNGKKRGQQYFSIKVTLLAWLESDSLSCKSSWIEVADKFTEPMIVRGRSPGHYHDDLDSSDSGPSFKDGPPISSSEFPAKSRPFALSAAAYRGGQEEQDDHDTKEGEVKVPPRIFSQELSKYRHRSESNAYDQCFPRYKEYSRRRCSDENDDLKNDKDIYFNVNADVGHFEAQHGDGEQYSHADGSSSWPGPRGFTAPHYQGTPPHAVVRQYTHRPQDPPSTTGAAHHLNHSVYAKHVPIRVDSPGEKEQEEDEQEAEQSDLRASGGPSRKSQHEIISDSAREAPMSPEIEAALSLASIRVGISPSHQTITAFHYNDCAQARDQMDEHACATGSARTGCTESCDDARCARIVKSSSKRLASAQPVRKSTRLRSS